MTTNFALSLSSDGIQLLQRADDGWLLVGKTDIDVPDLGAALAALREDAMRLAPDGMQTKLLIPNEQIKYITLETAQTSLADVQTALQGATPYPVDELVIDFDRNGGRTYIAAVARETLEEAEAFAATYDFTPQSFAAIAAPDTFQSEVFFGPAKAAKGPVARDAAAVVVTGKVTMPVHVVEEAEVTGPAPIFTPRPRMADPESVATDALVKTAADTSEKPDDPVLAVPTGQSDGPKIASPDISTPPPPAKPVETTAPAVSGSAKPVLAAPRAEDMAATGGFASRRKAPEIVVEAPDTPEASGDKPDAFATKQAQAKRGKPRFLGLILTAILLLAMALVAVWASTLTEEDLANWFGYSSGGIVEITETTAEPTPTQVIAAAPQADDATVTAAIADTPPDDPLPQVRATAMGQVLSPAEADRIYAATGVWQRAPRLPLEPRSETLSTPLPRAEPTLAAFAMPELPTTSNMSPDLSLIAPSNPPAAGTDFARDADGFILATPEGTLTPEGAIVFSGPPSKRPPLRPQRETPVADAPAQTQIDGVIVIAGRPSKVPPLRPPYAALPDILDDRDTAGLEGARPETRPEGLIADEEVVAFADPALATARPKLRPAGLAPAPTPDPVVPQTPAVPDITDVVAAITAAAPPSPFVNATARAIRASPRPDPRPRNFARVVSRATNLAAQQAARQQVAAAPAAAVSNAPARASGAVPGGVANAATLQNAIKLRDVNLIGVYGSRNDRRALVRLGNGRYVKVEVGSSLDGGRVSAIGDSALNYVKRGRTIAIQLPNG